MLWLHEVTSNINWNIFSHLVMLIKYFIHEKIYKNTHGSGWFFPLKNRFLKHQKVRSVSRIIINSSWNHCLRHHHMPQVKPAYHSSWLSVVHDEVRFLLSVGRALNSVGDHHFRLIKEYSSTKAQISAGRLRAEKNVIGEDADVQMWKGSWWVPFGWIVCSDVRRATYWSKNVAANVFEGKHTENLLVTPKLSWEYFG